MVETGLLIRRKFQCIRIFIFVPNNIENSLFFDSLLLKYHTTKTSQKALLKNIVLRVNVLTFKIFCDIIN